MGLPGAGSRPGSRTDTVSVAISGSRRLAVTRIYHHHKHTHVRAPPLRPGTAHAWLSANLSCGSRWRVWGLGGLWAGAPGGLGAAPLSGGLRASPFRPAEARSRHLGGGSSLAGAQPAGSTGGRWGRGARGHFPLLLTHAGSLDSLHLRGPILGCIVEKRTLADHGVKSSHIPCLRRPGGMWGICALSGAPPSLLTPPSHT